MQQKQAERVSLSFDREAGEGWMLIHPDAHPHEIAGALERIDAAGFEELDPLETGDDPDWDEHGRMMIPLVRRMD